MLNYCIERSHQGVTLLSALRMQDLVLGPRVVRPDVTALAAVKLASKWQARSKHSKLRPRSQPLEHGLSGNMVERTDRRHACSLESVGEVLGQGSGDKAAKLGHAHGHSASGARRVAQDARPPAAQRCLVEQCEVFVGATWGTGVPGTNNAAEATIKRTRVDAGQIACSVGLGSNADCIVKRVGFYGGSANLRPAKLLRRRLTQEPMPVANFPLPLCSPRSATSWVTPTRP